MDQREAVVREVSPADKVMITLGSMTEGASYGSMNAAPVLTPDVPDGAWQLWRRIAGASRAFGNPHRFSSDPARTLWTSFTVTLKTPDFFDFMSSFTGNEAGTGGLVTFKHSGWLLSVVLAHQPHFASQDANVHVFWGYGLHPQGTGDALAKPMLECGGEEILMELAQHLGVTDQQDTLFRDAICIPCLMPYITSQFMPRLPGDRPAVVPSVDGNFAFVGQCCELPDDAVFIVEYSVRSALVAVHGMLDVDRPIPPLYRGFEKAPVVGRALLQILGNGRSV